MNSTEQNCEACGGTGWDSMFDSPCGLCGAHEQDIDQAQAQQAAAERDAETRAAMERDNALIAWLADIDGDEFAASLVEQYTNRGELSERQWAAARKMQEQADQYRFTKFNDTWAIYGPEGTEGDEVTVTKANGETKTAWLGPELGVYRGRPAYECMWDAPIAVVPVRDSQGREVGVKPADDRVQPEAGRFYTNDAGDIIKVQESRTSGALYAKVMDDAGKWQYEGRAPFNTAGFRALTIEEAAAYGKATGQCMICSRTLTNPDSIEAGIGPVCATKL